MQTTDQKLPLTEAVYYILLSLTSPLHGYGVMQYIREISAGRVDLGPGTLYGALNSLLEKGWIRSVPSTGRKKEYVVTPEGLVVLRGELQRLQELVNHGQMILWEGRS